MSRIWPQVSTPERTLHLIGDNHYGANVPTTAKPTTRGPKIINDLGSPLIPDVAAHVFLGDNVNDGLTSQDADFLAYQAQFPGTKITALGGHDFWNGVRTPAAAAAALGMSGVSYVQDLGFLKVAVLGCDSTDAFGSMILNAPGSGGQIDWLDDTLASDPDTPYAVAFHQPLNDTVGRDAPADQFRSIDAGFFNSRDADLRTVIGARSNLRLWLSGHTHTPTYDTALASVETIGGNTIGCVNGSSPFYNHSTGITTFEPIRSVYVTYLDDSGGERIEVRFRDHGARRWGEGIATSYADLSTVQRAVTIPLEA